MIYIAAINSRVDDKWSRCREMSRISLSRRREGEEEAWTKRVDFNHDTRRASPAITGRKTPAELVRAILFRRFPLQKRPEEGQTEGNSTFNVTAVKSESRVKNPASLPLQNFPEEGSVRGIVVIRANGDPCATFIARINEVWKQYVSAGKTRATFRKYVLFDISFAACK